MQVNKNILAEELISLLKDAEKNIDLKTILHKLPGRGHALLLIILSLPFCQPIQIPGFSTPFGLVIAFVGLRIAFGHKMWIPRLLLEAKVSIQLMRKIAYVAIKITNKLSFFTRTRLTFFLNNKYLHIFNGILISTLGLILALPLPIPFTNVFTAMPLLLYGLAMLEDDGLLLIIAYFLTGICCTFFFLLLLLGKEGLDFLRNWL